jgi:hypothetical protein
MYFDASTRKCGRLLLWAVGLILILSLTADAQKKSRPKAPAKPKPVDEHAKLREQFIAATNDYKSSLEKLQAIYARNVKQAEDKLAVSRKLLEEGLVSRNQVEENERAVASERDKLAETQRQMAGADAQVAGMLTSTTAMIRYQGTGAWSLGDVWKVQKFFVDSFRKPLPIAVLGQGAIHDRWRLDHRNSMDISLHPDGVEGRALLNFLQKNGIPFLAFREAIPGTATGAHIHIGRPSHRY